MNKGIYIESSSPILVIAAVALTVLIGIGLVSFANPPLSGSDIDRIVREVQGASDGDNVVNVQVQAAAGIGIIQRAESAQAVTKTDTVQAPAQKAPGLPAWQLILIVSACFLPFIAMFFWLMFDR